MVPRDDSAACVGWAAPGQVDGRSSWLQGGCCCWSKGAAAEWLDQDSVRPSPDYGVERAGELLPTFLPSSAILGFSRSQADVLMASTSRTPFDLFPAVSPRNVAHLRPAPPVPPAPAAPPIVERDVVRRPIYHVGRHGQHRRVLFVRLRPSPSPRLRQRLTSGDFGCVKGDATSTRSSSASLPVCSVWP